MSKPFPDFTAPEFRAIGRRGKLCALREFILDHEGPIPQSEVRRLFAETCKIAADMVSGTDHQDRWSGENADERLFLDIIAGMGEA